MTSSLTSRIGLLATGNELTEGDILNTNGQTIVQTLAAEGFTIGLHVITPDTEEDIKTALEFLLSTHAAVIITGGLGPTSDDRTRYALASVLGTELVFDETSWEFISARIQQRLGHEPHQSNRQQALFPRGAHIMANINGTAPGCWLEHQDKLIFMLPGPPRECLPLFSEVVLPTLISKLAGTKKIKYSWQLQGIAEAEIAALIDEAVKNYPVLTGYRAHFPILEVKIYTAPEAHVEEMLAMINTIVGPYLIIKE